MNQTHIKAKIYQKVIAQFMIQITKYFLIT